MESFPAHDEQLDKNYFSRSKFLLHVGTNNEIFKILMILHQHWQWVSAYKLQ